MSKILHIEPRPLFCPAYFNTWHRQDLTVHDKAVLQDLKTYAPIGTDNGKNIVVAEPSIKRIAADLRIGESTVIRSLKTLEERGILERKRRGHMKTNVYGIRENEEAREEHTDDILSSAADLSVEEITKLIEQLQSILDEREKDIEKGPANNPTPASDCDYSDAHFSKSGKGYNCALHRQDTMKTECVQDANKENFAPAVTLEDVKAQIEYDLIKQDSPELEQYLDAAVQVMADVYNTKTPVKIRESKLPPQAVQAVYKRLNKIEVENVLARIRETIEEDDKEIKDIYGYIRTALYRAEGDNMAQVKRQFARYYKKRQEEKKSETGTNDTGPGTGSTGPIYAKDYHRRE